MKKLYVFLFAMALTTLTFANVNPTNPELDALENGKAKIENKMSAVSQIEQIVENEGLTYDELAIKYPALVAEANLASEMEDGIFEGSDDVPLGVPGFWWGFCLGWIGLLIVYLTMDEGEERKEQVKNALYGCIGAGLLWIILYVAFWGILFSTAV